MTDSRLAIVVLAAGQGTRMKSSRPKVLHDLAGVPLLGHVLATARELSAAHVVTVVRHERDLVAAAVDEFLPGSTVVDQDDIPGTGRAVEVALGALSADFEGEVVIVSGDVPMLDADTLTQLIAEHRAAAAGATLLSAVLDDAHGYGRVVRGANGDLESIVEHKDATDEQRAIAEVNSGTYVFSVGPLREHLALVTTDNVQNEKYLTDVVAMIRESGSVVAAMPVAQPWIVAGINDRAQLGEAALRMNQLIVRGHQLNGVTILDPASTWIDLEVSIGAVSYTHLTLPTNREV